MSRFASCSHCGERGHNKRACPDIGRDHDELIREREQRVQNEMKAVRTIREVLGLFGPERRVELVRAAFTLTNGLYMMNLGQAMREREEHAKKTVNAELDLYAAEPAKKRSLQ